MTLEENFEKIEELFQVLESDEISLEDSFHAYQKGMKLLEECNAQIDQVEKQVLKLTENGSLEGLE